MKHFWTLTISVALIGSTLAWSQDAPKLNARELFYSPPPSPAASTASTSTTSTGTAGTGTTVAGRSGASSGTTTAGAGNTGKGKAGGSTAAGATGAQKSAPVVAGTGKGGAASGGTTTSGAETGAVTAATGNAPTTTGGTSTAGTNHAATDNGTIVAGVGQAGNLINASATNGPLGLRYAVLKRDSGNTFREVDPETKFRTGDSIRLHVTPSTSGYLYVVQQGASGIWTLLFPRPDVANGSNFVEKGQMLAVPGDRSMWTFDANAGEEKLFIVLARKPEPDLDKLIYSIGGAGGGSGQKLVAQAAVRDDVVNHLRDQMLSRDLVFEKVDESTTDSTGVKAETAAYVVSRNTAPDGRLVKDLTLSHQ